MVILLWILNGVLAIVFAKTGSFKLSRSRDDLRAAGMGWVDSFPRGSEKAIGFAEICGAIGLVAPLVTGIARVLAPISALALMFLLLGAIGTHLRRKERATFPLVLAVFCLLSALLGFVVIRD
ncbi:DoxX family protein [Microbacterium sp. LMC-P-041]|uniref:DoxX family protein n=1 Tax=unclassified Microbacterium TaxID=2609290 RepID=UPI002554A089|nr:DoxX family protein [Microbacterium sp. LMC-P-041]